ncbi:helix-turn-helix transcriptional regulator [Agrobacterium radiobacter]|uniref:helix-turn-helix transcriptional regulator n=1 Tax=Agrobacterium radiobacter TaxID=362 RepID=UPI003F839CEF
MDLKSISPSFEAVYSAVEGAIGVYESLLIFQDAYSIDFCTYHLAATVIGEIDAPYVRSTYPADWVSKYFLNSLMKVDPIVKEGFTRLLPFDWHTLEMSSEEQAFISLSLSHGIGENGYSVPIRDKSQRKALLSINSNKTRAAWQRLRDHSAEQWTELAQLIHRKAIFEMHGKHDPIPILSSREIECLYWTSLGKDYKGVADIVGISEHTARGYLKSARFKLGCPTLSAATTKATQLRLIPTIAP